jgi:CMP-N,N'-diacetyllegionaminic acid synthase
VTVLHLVPFRAGSKGVPQKNLRKINRRSLAARAVSFGLVSGIPGPIVASSDCLRMLRFAFREIGVDVPPDVSVGSMVQVADRLFVHYRPPQHALDISPLGPVFVDAVVHAEQFGIVVTHLMLLQPTSPFRSADDSRNILSLLPSIGPDDSAVSVERMGDSHPARMYLSSGTRPGTERLQRVPGFAQHEFSPRQALPNVFLRDGAFYIVGRNLALKGIQLGERPHFFERSWPYTANIDSLRDLEEAKRIGRKFSL